MIRVQYVLKSAPTISLGTGAILVLLHYISGLDTLLAGALFVAIGIFLSLVWAGVFRRF